MITRRYRCPECAKEFRYDHHPSVALDPCPRFCPHCGFDSEGEYETALTMPLISTGAAKRTDGLLTAMDEGAEFRANVAREKLGLDAEAANMLRHPDTSAAPVNNAVTQAMAAMPSGSVGFNPATAVNYTTTVSTGPYPNAGAHAMQDVRRFHQQATAGIGHVGATHSELPALETVQPGYRRRA